MILLRHSSDYFSSTELCTNCTMALFGGLTSIKVGSVSVPLAAMFITDWSGFSRDYVGSLLSFGLIVVLGMMMIKEKKMGTYSCICDISVSFFYHYNFGTWLSTPLFIETGLASKHLYCSHSIFPSDFVSDLFFVGVMFGVYH